MREYQVTVNGITTTVQLSDDDARRAGITGEQPDDKSGQAKNKARTTKPGTSTTGRRGGGKKSRSRSNTDSAEAGADEGDDAGDD